MKIPRQTTAPKLNAHLKGRRSQAALVDWVERAMREADFAPADASVLRKVVPRIGVADLRAFGLTWADCAQLLRLLGFRAKIDVVAA